MSWDNKKTLTFIKEYEKRPVLWRKSDEHYHNVGKKEDAWQEISEIFDEDIAMLKKKIESLRGSRRREKNRALQRTLTGKDSTDKYISKWFAWNALKFLEDPEKIRTTMDDEFEETQTLSEYCTAELNDNTTSIVTNERSRKRTIQTVDKAEKLLDTIDAKLNDPEDEFTIVGKNIAVKLRKLPNETRIYAEKLINDILFRAELGQVNQHTQITLENI